MKILFCSGHAHLALDPAAERASGGAELQVALLAKELVKRGMEVVLLAADTGQGDHLILEGVKIRNGGRFDTGRLWDTCRALFRIIFILQQEKPDVVVLYGWTSLLYLFAKLRRFMHYRLLFVCALDSEIDGGFSRTHPWRGYFFTQGMYLCDARFGITEHQAGLFRAQGMECSVMRLLLQSGLSLNSTSAANCCVAPVLASSRTSCTLRVCAPEAPVTSSAEASFVKGLMLQGSTTLFKKTIDLLWVARCHPVKQPLLFLDLAESFPEARCQMICSPQDKKLWKEVKQRADSLPNVEFLETVPYRNIQSHFDRANIFVNTSLDEGVPNTFVQAGLGEVAIVSLCVDPDDMFHCFSAGGCAHGSKEKLITSIDQLLSSRELLNFAQHEAARFVREWHDNESNVKIFLNKAV